MSQKITGYSWDFGSNIDIDLYSITRYHLRMATDFVDMHPNSSFMNSINNLNSTNTPNSNRITQLERHWHWDLRHTGYYCTSTSSYLVNCCSLLLFLLY